MATIGTFGPDVVFSVSSEKVFTFSNFTYSKDERWGEISRIGKPPKLQFLGPNSSEVSMDVVLDATLGVKPWKTQRAILKIADKGEPRYLVIGGKKVGKSQFVISKVSEAWGIVMNDGGVLRMTLSLTFKEYF